MKGTTQEESAFGLIVLVVADKTHRPVYPALD